MTVRKRQILQKVSVKECDGPQCSEFVVDSLPIPASWYIVYPASDTAINGRHFHGVTCLLEWVKKEYNKAETG